MSMDAALLDYCLTDRQRQALQAVIDADGSISEASRSTGMHRHHIRRAIKSAQNRAAQAGYSPQHGINRPLPEHLMLRGTSALVDERSGETVLQWYKSGTDQQRLREGLIAAANAVIETLTPDNPTPPPAHTLDELLSVWVLTDYHMGMLSWAAETGDSWDIKLAERAMYEWASRALTLVPRSRRAVFAQLGDMLHYDTLDSVTPTGKHVLDADSRYPKIVEATVRALRRVVRLLLTHHDEVLLLMAEGNHDPVSSIWLRELFTALYENEPRVTVEKSPLPFYAVEHGKTSLFFHHGHLRKPKQIAEVFASNFREIMGRTEWSYAHMGHMHHTQVHETPLMIVEQHQTLAAKDAYAARGGWNSQRSAQVITYSRDHGEISRIRIPFSMLRKEENEDA